MWRNLLATQKNYFAKILDCLNITGKVVISLFTAATFYLKEYNYHNKKHKRNRGLYVK